MSVRWNITKTTILIKKSGTIKTKKYHTSEEILKSNKKNRRCR